MADIAEIGFKVDTTELKKAVGSLNEFSTASKKANSSAQVASSSISKSNQRMIAAASGATRFGNALEVVSRGEIEATAEMGRYGIQMTKAVKNQMLFEKATRGLTSAIKSQTIAQKALNSVSMGRPDTSAVLSNRPEFRQTPRDMMPNRFNTANIAAQFQDIGVTAAMGMNPLTIALQQGTQLSAILNSMQDPLKGLAVAFKSILNPVSLLSIGITALVASFIQLVDWSKVWESITYGLASGLNWLADNLETVTIAMGSFLALQVITHIGAITTGVMTLSSAVITLTKGLYSMAAGWLAAMGPVGWVAAGLAVVSVAIYKFKDEIANIIGEDVLNGIKTGINGFVAAFKNGVMIVYRSFQLLFHEIKQMAADFLNFFVTVGEKIEVVGASIGAVFDNGKYLAGRMKEYQGIRNEINKMLVGDSGKFEDKLAFLTQDVEDITMPKDYVGMALSGAGNVLEGLKQGLKDAANALTSSANTLDEKAAEAWDKLVKGVEGHKIELTQEADLIGRIGQDYEYVKTKYDLLNEAREAGITLTDAQTKYIEEQSVALAQQADEVRRLSERFEFAKSTTTGFFQDLKNNLIEGKNLWESFGNAVVNVLNKILDKILEIGIDMLFAAGKQAGWFNFGGSAYSTPIGPTQTANAAGFYGQALGGVWSHGVQKFARGGVVGGPTLFGAANGVGVMGEAGPEAIMPLQRGPNGALGVRADGIGGGNVVVNVINNSNAQASVNQRETTQGTEIDVLIDQVVAEKLGTQGTASNTAMNAWNNRMLIAR